MDLIDLVRRGYEKAALPYKQAKDTAVLRIPAFQAFLSFLPRHGNVLELGCASGYPVFEELSRRNLHYVGVDLSSAQIKLAHEGYPEHTAQFHQGEMLDFSQRQGDASFDGLLCLFTLFHLQRNKHPELFTQIKRILNPNSPLLFTIPEGPANEGFNEDWLGSKMFWSTYSADFYKVLLSELGFELITQWKDSQQFLGEREHTWFFLFKSPASDHPTIAPQPSTSLVFDAF